jgi:hypothetical protein
MRHPSELVPLLVLVGPLLYLAARSYVVAPLRIRRQQWREVEPRFEPVELTQSPPDVGRAFLRAAPRLAAARFAAVAHLSRHTGATGHRTATCRSGPPRRPATAPN